MNPSLPFDLQRRLDDELDSGERLLWAGQPNPGRMARQGGYLVAFGIPWTLFAVFWTLTASAVWRRAAFRGEVLGRARCSACSACPLSLSESAC